MKVVTDPVLSRLDATTTYIELNHPPLNIIDEKMMEALDAALDDAASNPNITAVVLQGAGNRAFSAGVSIHEHLPPRVGETLRRFHSLIRRLREMPCTTIAAVHGVALGGGCELAMACDFVLVDETAKFGQPEVDVGCFAPVACVLLPRLVGRQRAWEMMAIGRPIDAAEAHRTGLVNRVVPPDQLNAVVNEFCAALAAKSPLVLRLMREAARAAENIPSFDEALAHVERIYLDRLVPTADALEGLQAFIDKRPPTWKGA